MMNIRLYNARILKMESPVDIIEGSVWICDDKIEYIGDEKNLDKLYLVNSSAPLQKLYLWDQEIDCNQNLIMPGFQNTHTHSPMTAMRSMVEGMPLNRWLYEKVFPFESKLTEDDMFWFTKLAILEYLEGGMTGIFDMYFSRDAVAKACLSYHMPVCLCGAVNDFVQSVSTMEELYLKYNNPLVPLVTYQLGFHAHYTTNERMLREISELSHALKSPVYTHICETEKEVADCIKEHGEPPFSYLNQLGIFDYGGGGFHCVCTDENDIRIMKEKKISVITNPASNMKLASGIAPIQKYIHNGLLVAIGTDGAASNNSLSMFKEMFLVSGLAKLRENDANAVQAEDIVKMATCNGAIIMNNPDTGVLRKGAYADCIMIDLHRPNMQPNHNILNNLIYSADRSNVIMTIVRGNILFQNGKYNLPDEPGDVYEKCNEIISRII